MKKIRSKWRFNKAGQGCFYSGRIRITDNEQFNFVYDCGSVLGVNALEREIRRFEDTTRNFNEEKLNVLTISHLDYDHVSHIGKLLKGIKLCDTAILPYLSRLERLLVYLNHPDAAIDDSTYDEFMIDNAGFLFANNVRNVIFILGDDEGSETQTNADPISPPTGDEANRIVTIRFRDVFGTTSTEQQELQKINNVRLCKDKGKFFVKNFWEFYYYNKRMPNALLKEFRKWVEKTYNISISPDGLTDQQLKDILGDKQKIKSFKEHFVKEFGDVNSTGLTVLHGPLGNSRISLRVTPTKRLSGYAYYMQEFANNNGYTLLNGDTDLHTINYPVDILNQMYAVRVFQIPHHGSKKNWDIQALQELRFCYIVINFGWGNRYGHPADIVMTDIKKRRPWIRLNNTQLRARTYVIKLLID